MSTQTEHIGLHQWESADPFLREDFNDDNSKIDQAVEEVREQARQTAEGLEDMSYNSITCCCKTTVRANTPGIKRADIR